MEQIEKTHQTPKLNTVFGKAHVVRMSEIRTASRTSGTIVTQCLC